MSTFGIVGLGYVTIYPLDLPAAVAYYSSVFGPPDRDDPDDAVWGWRLGSTWLTLAFNAEGTVPGTRPANVEFAIEVTSVSEVDRLFDALVAAGGVAGRKPTDTVMYRPMRYAYVEDPFGVRIDVLHHTT
ncbi:MAG TPA: VOC family protein [Trueperaceae bacterium]|nr:VOC family protein [Trueperaceae bacterium]